MRECAIQTPTTIETMAIGKDKRAQSEQNFCYSYGKDTVVRRQHRQSSLHVLDGGGFC